jgi:AcrR family transcriptional regulator
MLAAMGRTARFPAAVLLAEAARLLAERGSGGTTISALSHATGAPVGSIYHRFGSRDLLLGELWLRLAEDFQEGFLAALPAGALEAALHTPRWVRAHPVEAQVLLLHRREDLVGGDWPPPLRSRAEALGVALSEALRAFAGPSTAVRRVAFALVDVPYAAVRRHLVAGETPPAEVDELVATVCAAVLEP